MKTYEKPNLIIKSVKLEDILLASGIKAPDIDGNSGGFLSEWLKNA